MTKALSPRTRIIIAMLIWGTIGLFVRGIQLDSISIAFFRAAIGSIFLLLISFIIKDKIDKEVLKKNLILLILSGIVLSINWTALFQAMKYTTIPIAILSYHTAPIFITVFSAIFLKEKITKKNIMFLSLAIVGVLLVLDSGGDIGTAINHTKGIMYGILGAVSYGIAIILNKLIKDLSGFQRTLIQLSLVSIILLPIVIGQGNVNLGQWDLKQWILVLIIGIIHTGLAYLLYFPSIKDVKGSTIAILTYLDPIIAILTSFVFLKESMTPIQALGGALIFAAAYFGDK
ncbi:MAG: DMT family transporter [Tissierellaceae bacterium]|nr:DMT family transporter [Tissierellaceae bacterium]